MVCFTGSKLPLPSSLYNMLNFLPVKGASSIIAPLSKDVETISNRLSVATRGINSSYGPTGMQISSLTKAKSLIIKLGEMIDNLDLEFTKLKNQVESELDSYILD